MYVYIYIYMSRERERERERDRDPYVRIYVYGHADMFTCICTHMYIFGLRFLHVGNAFLGRFAHAELFMSAAFGFQPKVWALGVWALGVSDEFKPLVWVWLCTRCGSKHQLQLCRAIRAISHCAGQQPTSCMSRGRTPIPRQEL